MKYLILVILQQKTALNIVENKTPDISSLVDKSDYNREITSIKLNLNKLQAYDLSYLKGNNILMKEVANKII